MTQVNWQRWAGLFLMLGMVVSMSTGGCLDFGGKKDNTNSSQPPQIISPVVNTGSAMNVTSNSATLTGMVNPNSTATTAYFQYGTTTAYGANTVSQLVGNGTVIINTSANVTGLASATTYYYRIVATNPGGTAYGADQVFTTGGAIGSAPTATTNPATVGSTYVTLNGAVNPNGLDTTAYFGYGLTTSYGITTTGQSFGSGSTNVSVTANLTGLTSNTTYHYRLVASNSTGVSYGTNQTFTTSTIAPPPDVSQLIAAARTALENQNVPLAKTKFEEALALDPNHKDANFGAAMTKVILLIEDPDVVNIITKWDQYAPTVQNIIYSVLDNSFEVYGSNTPYYNDDSPAKHGCTKLITTQTTSPYTYTGPFTYYIIYTPPFSKVQIDAINASTGIQMNPSIWDGEVEGFPNSWDQWNMGTIGDGKYIILGGESFSGSTWVVKANANAQNVTVYTVGSATAKRIAPLTNLTKNVSAPSADTATETTQPASTARAQIYNQLTGLTNKLPKNKASLLQHVRKAVASIYPATAPSVSEMQAVIDNKILPVIDDAIAKFRAVQGKSYTFTITPPMTGNAEVVNTVLDDGEFYGYDVLLSSLRMVLNFVTAYHLDVDWNIIEADPLSCLNGPSGGLTSTVDYTKFFTLKSNGSAKMNIALASLKEAVDKAELCYNFVFSQWGYLTSTTYGGITYLWPTRNPNDNGLKLHDPVDFYSFPAEDDTDARKGFDFTQMVLTGQSTFTVAISGGTQTTTLSTTDSSMVLSTDVTADPDSANSFVFDITKFFTNPLTRANLPVLGYEFPINGALSQTYKDPTYQYVNAGWDGIQGNNNDTTVESVISIKSELPDGTWTFNGMFPNKFADADASVYLDRAVLLDQAAWWWSNALASDGTSIYLAQYGYPNWNIRKINPSTGALIATYSITLPANYYAINDLTWHKSALWATGSGSVWTGYPSYQYYHKSGVFKINLITGLPENEIAITSTDYTYYSYLRGLASDGTYLYASTSSGGILRFVETDTTLPLVPLFTLDEDSEWMSYDGSYLWCNGDWGPMKVSPTDGTVIKRYSTWEDGDGLLYLNNRIWMVDDERLLLLIAP